MEKRENWFQKLWNLIIWLVWPFPFKNLIEWIYKHLFGSGNNGDEGLPESGSGDGKECNIDTDKARKALELICALDELSNGIGAKKSN